MADRWDDELEVHTELAADGRVVTTLLGTFDPLTFPRFRRHLEACERPPDLVDLRFVELVSAAGLSQLVWAARRSPLGLLASTRVERILVVAGLEELVEHGDERQPALDDAPFGFALHDEELRYVYANRALGAINGLAPSAHLGRRGDELFDPVVDDVTPALERAVRTGRATTLLVMGDTNTQHGTWRCRFLPVRLVVGDRIVTRVAARVERAAASEADAAAELLFSPLGPRTAPQGRA